MGNRPVTSFSAASQTEILLIQVVAFPTDDEAQKSEKVWAKGAPFKGRVASMNPRAQKAPSLKRGGDAFVGFAKALEAKKKQKAAAGGKGGGGLAGKPLIARIAPPGTEVLLVVAPKQPELMVSSRSRRYGRGEEWGNGIKEEVITLYPQRPCFLVANETFSTVSCVTSDCSACVGQKKHRRISLKRNFIPSFCLRRRYTSLFSFLSAEQTVQKLSKDLGQGCLIVLLNARLHQASVGVVSLERDDLKSVSSPACTSILPFLLGVCLPCTFPERPWHSAF